MGKVVRAIAVIAVAAAIAYFAPQLAPQLLQALGTATATAAATTAATIGISVGLSVAAAAAFAVIAGRPTTAAAGAQPSKGLPLTRSGMGWEYPPLPSRKSMSPVGQSWLHDEIFFLDRRRFVVSRAHGDCMRGVMPVGRSWIVVDRIAPIREGDLMVFRPDDLWAYMRATHGIWTSLRANGLVKRFLGIDPDRRTVVYETTFPPQRIETGVDRLRYAYRVASSHDNWRDARRERARLEREAA